MNSLEFTPLPSPLPFKPLASYPIYFKDLYGDIYDLDIEQKSIYFELLFYRFRTGKNLPKNEKELFKTLKFFKKNHKKIAKILLLEFFITYQEFYINRRQEEELLKAHEKHLSNSKKARDAAIARWEQKRSDIINNASSIKESDAPSIPPSNSSRYAPHYAREMPPHNPNPITLTPNIKTPTPNTGNGGFKKIDLVGGVGKMLKVIDVTGQLSGLDIQEIQRVAPNWDIEHLAKVYVDGINSGKREAPNSIPKAFPKWCEKYTGGKAP